MQYLSRTTLGIFALLIFVGLSAPQMVHAQSDASEASTASTRDEPDKPSKDDDKPEIPDGHIWIDGPPLDGQNERTVTRSTYESLANDASPAVVNVIVTYGPGTSGEDFRPDFSLPGPHGGTAQGSGFIIHRSGYILTNHHVIENASSIKIRMKDRSEYQASVVGIDPQTDIALLSVDRPKPFPALRLGDSDNAKVGQMVVAIGNPLGLNHTVSSGIISALGRSDLAIEGNKTHTDFIQIDAAINPGNSGGPLVNLDGDVIGINTAINRQGQGIGFAIPINMVKTLLPQLYKQGYVTRSWLGARVQGLTPALAKSYGIERVDGALVTEVVSESPAARGGLNAGDIILNFAGNNVRSSDQLPWLVATTSPNQMVDVVLMREGERQTVQLTLTEHPDQERPALPVTDAEHENENASAPQPRVAIEVKPLNDKLARQLGANSKSGIVVTKVAESSPARQAGLRQRDVITTVGNVDISNEREFNAALKNIEEGQPVRLKLVRGGRIVFIAFER